MPLKQTVFLSLMLLAAPGVAQPAAPDARHELLDVASFFNGGFPYTTFDYHDGDRIDNQLRAISQGRTINPFYRNDLSKDGSLDAVLFYALAAPATIETFRVGGEDKQDQIPRRIAFAVSASPAGDFQTVAAFDVPEAVFAAARPRYDFSIPASQKIAGRYLRITLSGAKYGRYRLNRFSALGRFEQPVALREDFNGIYYMQGRNANSPADAAMVEQQKGTAYHPYLILHQNGSQISGCYVYATSNGGGSGGIGGKKGLLLREISEVLGTIDGGVENNVFRFTRTYAKDGGQSQGAMALLPVAQGINRHNSTSYLLVERGDGQAGDGAFRGYITRFLSPPPVPCAVAGQKEKSANEVMAENLEKTGKVQLYGVNFDFDADTLRPESGAVLDAVVKLAQANPGWKFEIGGHTDSVGAADYNLNLSERRAASVVRYLAGKGVDAARLQARGYGASRPLVPETAGDDAARAQNRRVELVKQ